MSGEDYADERPMGMVAIVLTLGLLVLLLIGAMLLAELERPANASSHPLCRLPQTPSAVAGSSTPASVPRLLLPGPQGGICVQTQGLS